MQQAWFFIITFHFSWTGAFRRHTMHYFELLFVSFFVVPVDHIYFLHTYWLPYVPLTLLFINITHSWTKICMVRTCTSTSTSNSTIELEIASNVTCATKNTAFKILPTCKIDSQISSSNTDNNIMLFILLIVCSYIITSWLHHHFRYIALNYFTYTWKLCMPTHWPQLHA